MATSANSGGGSALIRGEDKDFLAAFLETYKSLSADSRDLVLAFVRGMEFQRELVGERPRSSP